jgi:RNA polymerase primary sigma factor
MAAERTVQIAAERPRKVKPVRKASDPSESSANEANTLALYFREITDLEVMSPEEEAKSARRIVRLREELWRSILAYPPFVGAICELTEQELGNEDDLPRDLLASAPHAARAYRDRETKANREGYASSVVALAQVMSHTDTDGRASDKVLSDIGEVLEGRRGDLHMEVKFPRKGSEPYQRYVRRARNANAALWTAKNGFVKSNLRLVVSMARRFTWSGMPLADLIQEGNIGLLKAVDRFDPRRGYRFSTYGSWWIRHAISRALADKGREVRLPVHMLDVYHRLSRKRREFETRHGRSPTDEELAEEANVPLDKICKMRNFLMERGPSLDSPLREGDGRTGVDLLVDLTSEQPGERLEAGAMGKNIREVLDELRPIEADILRKRFGLEAEKVMTLKEIGEEYSLSRERIRQLQEQALIKMRREFGRRKLL